MLHSILPPSRTPSRPRMLRARRAIASAGRELSDHAGDAGSEGW
eukprot:CAMPEP_0176250682 /NCGR_PEP_ID=MMETSP0121_2-20121125/34609_1 /TAXON_ID=160619 /ORGANISM="Kryptoperidinium foliaceum, Strain CCMP 1326" /LENGTH=43 /DNA_ID= /DNA_START= /DNA_END= /DNA_ORIENTATION=